MSDFFIVGMNDSDCMLDGWHEKSIHQPTGILYRPTKPIATFQIKINDTQSAHNSPARHPPNFPVEKAGGALAAVDYKQTSFINLHLFMAASPSLIKKNITGKIICDENLIGDFSLSTDLWQLLSFPISEKFLQNAAQVSCLIQPQDKLIFRIITETPLIPHQYLNNGDHREMGVYLSFALLMAKDEKR